MALITLAEAKDQLDLDSDDHDTELTRYINALTAPIERYVGPVENREVAEVIEGRSPTLCLSSIPAVSIASIVPVLSTGQAITVNEVHLDGATGIVRRLNGGTFRGGLWTVTYTAGRTTVPDTIKLAALILLQHLWRTQYGAARGGSGGGDDYDVNEPIVGWGYAIPNRVLQLLEPYKVPPAAA
ncbi:phage gp6-like head-tail connector protein [Streptomyces sp. adm13(2018)]|uniref:head-tail connector protein n=1 Tax=Streptomyces sp. adm13(2018) TaxID=2479007 RepID=UPI0011CD8689|nr:head-tail connector protein [Streptomyces sp. adm13(2018)]TXS20209.1 phage gp6-like head-tail connector protein [Streptomyces sp. adm13(2018)]